MKINNPKPHECRFHENLGSCSIPQLPTACFSLFSNLFVSYKYFYHIVFHLGFTDVMMFNTSAFGVGICSNESLWYRVITSNNFSFRDLFL
ncbi:hypothetical protein HanRHA438_Chr12g0573021 [Helianthus annuus]|nr:hypothetical protein HanRHA438_Chr12g0573021 [Helianthus annuus]